MYLLKLHVNFIVLAREGKHFHFDKSHTYGGELLQCIYFTELQNHTGPKLKYFTIFCQTWRLFFCFQCIQKSMSYKLLLSNHFNRMKPSMMKNVRSFEWLKDTTALPCRNASHSYLVVNILLFHKSAIQQKVHERISILVVSGCVVEHGDQ